MKVLRAIEWFSFVFVGGMPLLNVWSLRRVLLAGPSCAMMRIIESELHAVGARLSYASVPFDEESLSRRLQQRCTCVIVPDLSALCAYDPNRCTDMMNMLLFEAREAGVPLVMLLCPVSAVHGGETAQLFPHALGFARGAFGDPVSVQCIRHSGSDPQRICRDALTLGARFLAGDHACTGILSLTP